MNSTQNTAMTRGDAIAEASVHGAPDDRLGEVVCATIYLKSNSTASKEDIQAHAGSQLAAYKIPEHIFFTEEPLPRIASGKFDKRNLQQLVIDTLQNS